MYERRHLVESKRMEAVAMLRDALNLLDSIELHLEAALVCEALEMMTTGVVTHA